MITLADGTQRNCDKAVVSLKTPYITGKVRALVLDSQFVDVVIGNNVKIVIPNEKEKEVEISVENTCAAEKTRLQSKMERSLSNSSCKSTDKDSKNDCLKHLWCNREKLRELQE